MAKRITAAAAIAAIALSGVTSALAATNLLKNGGFEKPVVPDGSYQLYSTGQTFAHWTVVGDPGNVAPISGDFTQNGFTFPARAGAQWVDLTGASNTATGVAQTVSTTPGAQYTLIFSVGNVYDPGGIFGTTSTVNAFVDGNLVKSATNSLGQGSSSQVWKRFSVTFTAQTASTTISLINGDPSNDTENGLDAVKLLAAG